MPPTHFDFVFLFFFIFHHNCFGYPLPLQVDEARAERDAVLATYKKEVNRIRP